MSGEDRDDKEREYTRMPDRMTEESDRMDAERRGIACSRHVLSPLPF